MVSIPALPEHDKDMLGEISYERNTCYGLIISHQLTTGATKLHNAISNKIQCNIPEY